MSKLDRLKALYAELGRKQVKVGYFDNAKYPDGTPIAYVAAIQELGCPSAGIPPRPTLRPAMSENKAGYAALTANAVKAATKGAITLNGGLTQIGAKAASDVQMAIKAVTAPPLKEGTIAARARRHHKKKASTKPLVDSGAMLQAVSFVVEDK